MRALGSVGGAVEPYGDGKAGLKIVGKLNNILSI
jgi:hypothetical protein